MEYRKIKKDFTQILLCLVRDDDRAVQHDIVEEWVEKTIHITDSYVLAYYESNATSCLPMSKQENFPSGHWHIYIHRQPEGDDHSYATDFKDVELRECLTSKMDHELHAQQYTVHCPFSVYAQMSKNGVIMKSRGAVFEEFEKRMKTKDGQLFPKRLPVHKKKMKERVLWELRKQSTLFNKEKRLSNILSGVHGNTMEHVLEVMEKGIGYINRTVHGHKFTLDVGPAEYRCYCDECSNSVGGSTAPFRYVSKD
jgi:hypothetical protein